jgi:hypothetical protein
VPPGCSWSPLRTQLNVHGRRAHLKWCNKRRGTFLGRVERRRVKACEAQDTSDQTTSNVGLRLPGAPEFVSAGWSVGSSEGVVAGLNRPGIKNHTDFVAVWAPVASKLLGFTLVGRLLKRVKRLGEVVSRGDCPICGGHSITYPFLCLGYLYRVTRHTEEYVEELAQTLGSNPEMESWVVDRRRWAQRYLRRETAKTVAQVVDAVLRIVPVKVIVATKYAVLRHVVGTSMEALDALNKSVRGTSLSLAIRAVCRHRSVGQMMVSLFARSNRSTSSGTVAWVRSKKGTRIPSVRAGGTTAKGGREEKQRDPDRPQHMGGGSEPPSWVVTQMLVCFGCGSRTTPLAALSFVDRRFRTLCEDCVNPRAVRDAAQYALEWVYRFGRIPLVHVPDQHVLGNLEDPLDLLEWEAAMVMIRQWHAFSMIPGSRFVEFFNGGGLGEARGMWFLSLWVPADGPWMTLDEPSQAPPMSYSRISAGLQVQVSPLRFLGRRHGVLASTQGTDLPCLVTYTFL